MCILHPIFQTLMITHHTHPHPPTPTHTHPHPPTPSHIPSIAFMIFCNACGPPICLSSCGGSILLICAMFICILCGFMPLSDLGMPFTPPFPPMPDTTAFNLLNSSSSSMTWAGLVPEPLATRMILEFSWSILMLLVSSSASVMLSIMVRNRLRRACDSCS